MQPTDRPRFHITADQALLLLYNQIGTTPATESQTGSYAVRIEANGTVSDAVRIPLARPLTDTFFTATPRSGNRPADTADLLISDTIDGKPAARYVRLRFGRPETSGTP